MIRVGVHGAAGRMGAHVLAAVEAADDLVLAAALDRADHPRRGERLGAGPGIPLSSDLEAGLGACDVVVDFSLPEPALHLVEMAVAHKRPVVVATTGFSDAERTALEACARQIPLVVAPNFSRGIHALVELVERAARLLPDYEIEVLELHHSGKVDAPSGTALRLGEAAAQARGQKLADVAVYHREGHTGARDPRSIGLQTLRAGSSPGEHTVFLAGPGERIELTHRALSRDGFATGAVHAARWLVAQPAGLYGMRDVLA